jgi:hypothetical protein
VDQANAGKSQHATGETAWRKPAGYTSCTGCTGNKTCADEAGQQSPCAATQARTAQHPAGAKSITTFDAADATRKTGTTTEAVESF